MYESKATYFGKWEKVNGLNADIKRHDDRLKHLYSRMDNETSETHKRVWKGFINSCEYSKAQLTSQIGKHNEASN